MSDLATFNKLFDKWMSASAKGRSGQAADHAGEAADTAFALFGGDSLAGVLLRQAQATAYQEQAATERGQAQAALFLRTFSLLQTTIPIILRRHRAGTLMPGKCRLEEVEAKLRLKREGWKNAGTPFRADEQRHDASCMGYECAVKAAILGIMLLAFAYGGVFSAPKKDVEQTCSFLFVFLDLVSSTAGVRFLPGSEQVLSKIVKDMMDAQNQDAAFLAAFLRKRNSPEVAGVIRDRASPARVQAVLSACTETYFSVKKAKDVIKHGFASCGLETCDKMETTVRQFKVCSACKEVSYCSEEHQTAAWKHHRKECVASKNPASGGGFSA